MGSHTQPTPPMVVFCDLDDTLFDRRAFSVDASGRLALQGIERDHIALVICSARTRAEIELVQKEIGISQPFICENGAAVLVPSGYFGFGVAQGLKVGGYEAAEFGKPYADVVCSLRHAADRLGIQVVGFSDMSVEEVAIACDLSLLQARLAKLREYNEVFRIVGGRSNTIPRLFRALRGAGLTCATRGRYHHVGALGFETGGQFLSDLYRRAFGKIPVVAFGDHVSAAPLLRRADVPLIVRSAIASETERLAAEVPAARLISADSIESWGEAIVTLASAATSRSNHECTS